MKRSGIAFVLIMILGLLAMSLPSCTSAEPADSYVAVVPKVLQSGETESFSIALLRGNSPAAGKVEAVLLNNGKALVSSRADISGRGLLKLDIPDIEEGTYELRIKGDGFEDSAPVKVTRDSLLFLQTDKPIYKPGQTLFMRVLSLNGELRPTTEVVTVEVLDAKGIKVFRSEVVTDEYGMADLELPLSTEPNLGTWKITASSAKTKTQLDVRVEEYVLPKYEVTVDLAREWFLVDEAIKGTISAEYSFGKTVAGELDIRASRYIGQWQQYAEVTKTIDGNTDFEIPAAGYVAGVPAAGGSGNVMLDITVREKSTGYEEKTSRLLTVAQSDINLQLIPESSVFKPGLPFSVLLVSETPGNVPADVTGEVTTTYLDRDYKEIKHEDKSVKTDNGKSVVNITPPDNAVALVLEVSANNAQTSKMVTASYSPSGNFIHLEQTSQGTPKAGDTISFRIYSTNQASNFYYEVVSRGKVVFSDFTKRKDIDIDTTPTMSGSSKLIVYQVLPNSEVAADYLPFEVEASYPQNVSVNFSESEAKPGDQININIQTEGEAKVGLAAVDRSVFILAENRLNLQQVFDQLERLYMMPQAELHEASIYPAIETMGAIDILDEAGVTVLTNNNVPEGKDYQFEGQSGFWDRIFRFFNGGGRDVMFGAAEKAVPQVPAALPPTTVATQTASDTVTGLAEVQRVRQFFPETWLWDTRIVGPSGKASIQVDVPDTITTWMLQAVAISKDKGLGMAEDQLKAFQPFFLSVDLPYSAIRGEEFPVEIAIYNYLDQPQSVIVHLDGSDWFDLIGESQKTIDIEPNDIGAASFTISPTKLGTNSVKVTAQSSQAADAVVKTVIIEPAGVAREEVENLTLSDGTSTVVDSTLPSMIVDGSGRVYLTLTSSYLTQTIDGLDGLIQMPFGCGEQNMILLAPDIFITRYLTESGQLKPEIMAKAEKLMITGYQRELTYRRSDGSFSAFGQSDQEGSLWLTAFVLKTFSQAKSLIYVDDSVLAGASDWITSHQNSDGSFDPVGFVHHQEMIGGVTGKTALTAYVATSLMEAGEKSSSGKAVAYLEGQLNNIDDPYTMAMVAYALEMAGSGNRVEAHNRLMGMAKEDENGLHWGEDAPILEPQGKEMARPGLMLPVNGTPTTQIEATAYATLALIEHGDALNASRASKWLVSKRNAYGGYGSTQDTVVTLQALTEQATGARADVDLTVTLKAGDFQKQLKINQQNFDVLQIAEITPGQQIEVSAAGKGEIIGQLVKRFNVPAAEQTQDQILKVDVGYDVTQVEVNDIVNVSVSVQFDPPEPMESGMVVVDVSVPTGFTPVADSIAQAVENEPRIKRYDVAGRKVIFYIENMNLGDKVSFGFQVQATYPVKAKGVTSQAYSYYTPEIRGETLSEDMTVQ